MKKILSLLIFIIPLVSFSQGNMQKGINWIELEDAKKYAKKYDKNILIYFYKNNCPYCEEMTKKTLIDPVIINLINKNFFAVKINARTKNIISYNGKDYGNQQPIADGSNWRHDFYFEVARFQYKGEAKLTTPTIVLFNPNFEKITVFGGKHPKQLLERKLKPYIK